ncbi:unnamed protein product [Arctia plantaginis]|uniref:Uncharacterized protein n=1 Tax=Arctia plantaginis TaxID=874455 RepID=A0A8S1BI69_ARCPL|nr:unnamed protein product [Arctia plantaginis]
MVGCGKRLVLEEILTEKQILHILNQAIGGDGPAIDSNHGASELHLHRLNHRDARSDVAWLHFSSFPRHPGL